jgi:hypothetical protein
MYSTNKCTDFNKKYHTLKKKEKKAADAKEIGSRNLGCQCSGINKRTIKFQTSWMKDRPWLFHD